MLDTLLTEWRRTLNLKYVRIVEDAMNECLASLEAAPGFRPAQKLLLELSNSQEPAAQPAKK